jgi:hypothetical protein
MTTILVVLAIAVSLVGAVTKLTSVLTRTQAPARRSLWLTIACLVITMAARLPQVGATVNAAVGFNVRWPINALLLMAAMYFFQMFFLYSVHGNDPSLVNGQRRWRLLTVLTCGIGVLALFMARPTAIDFVFGPGGRYEAGGPGDQLAQLSRILFALYMCFATLTLTHLGIRWAKKSGRGALQVGLGSFAAGSALGCVVAIHSAAHNLAVLVAVAPPWPEATVVAWLIPLAGTLQVTGVVIPALWPRLVRLRRWFAHRRALITLYPLWATMCTAAPNIVLDPIQTRWKDRLSISEMDYRLYRRIIEIWDAHRLLRQHISPQIREQALVAGRRRGLRGDRLAAAVEAASIDAALHALRNNQTPTTNKSLHDGRTRSDLAAEVAWWGSVTIEFRQLSTALP